MGCNYNIERSRASLGSGTNSGVSLGGLFIPWMNRYAREMTDGLSCRRRAP
jgi:hypothetical protein